MIGLKTISAVVIAAMLVAIAAARGSLSPSYLDALSGAAWFAIGAVASLACALVGVGWRFGVASRGAVALVDGRLALVDLPERGLGDSRPAVGRASNKHGADPVVGPASSERRADDVEVPRARELPGAVQRVLVLAGMVAIALGALGNHAAARIVQVPEQFGEPSPSAFCLPHVEAAVAAPTVPPPPPPDQAGCALVRRAFQLGYAKSLGSCAPKQVVVTPAAAAAKSEVCVRRHLDEPYLHYAYRRLADAFGSLGSTTASGAIARRTSEVRAHLEHASDLLADVRHAITGTPHASHHIWINLPDPHPTTIGERFTGAPRCSTRFADLPLWPAITDRSQLVEHVLGQLLFANRFGTTASCNDYTIHWGAPADACAQLVKNPAAFLGRDGTLTAVRDVLDRRRRQIAVAELDRTLGRKPPPPPPPVSAIASLACLSVDRASPASGTTVTLDGESLAVRELHVAALRADTDGPIDVYLALASLLAGTDVSGATPPGKLDTSRFMLLHLDELRDDDPFTGARWPLADPELVAVYPFEHHIHAFVDAFRRRYLPQRGRL